MKILILSINDNLGGAELYLKSIAKYFVDEELNLVFLTKNNTNDWNDLNSTTKVSYLANKSKVLGVLKFCYYLLSFNRKFDYVFSSHVLTNGLLGSMRSLGFLKTKNLICRESTSVFLRYTGFKLLYYKFIYLLGYKKIDLIICQTELMKTQLLKNFGKIETRSKIVVIPNPIDLDHISKKVKFETKYDFDYIVSAGRLIYEKGFDILIQSFHLLKKKCPRLKLVILGKGELQKDLIQLALNYNLEDDVIFEGHVPNVMPYFKNAKACVVSSRIEGFPNVLLQMMFANNVVVSTSCAGGIENIPGIHSCDIESAEKLYLTIDNALKIENNDTVRQLFEAYLQKRSISEFIQTLNTELISN